MPPRYSADAYSSQYVNSSPQSNGYQGAATPGWQRNANQQQSSSRMPKTTGAQSFGQAADEWRQVLTGYMRPSGNMTAAGRPAPSIEPQPAPAVPYTAGGIPPRGSDQGQWNGRAPQQPIPSAVRIPPSAPPVDPAPPQWGGPTSGGAIPPYRPPVGPAPPQWGGPPDDGGPMIEPQWGDPMPPPIRSDIPIPPRESGPTFSALQPNTVMNYGRQPLPFHESEIPQRLQRVASQFFGGNVRQAQNYLIAKRIL